MAAAAAASSCSSASASVSSVYDVSEEKTNGTRLARLLIDGGTRALREFLHSIHPQATLQHVLINDRLKLSKRVKFADQWEQLFPPSGDPPDSETFDITLLHLLIREICHLTAPLNGWHKMPAGDDESVEANITRIKCFRNKLCHRFSTGIPNDEFEDKWKQISSSLEALELYAHGYAYRQRIERLKNDPIDHVIQRRVEEQVNKWEELDNELVQFETEQESSKVPSCLPDELPEELMFGRLREIQQVTEVIQIKSVPVVWITGGPGFGKSTVAKKAAHKLAKPENDRTVLFCSLRSETTLHDVATLMTLACSKNQMQPPENPQHWLLTWSKQQVTKVTFVLDNADEVLEGADCKEFMGVLEKIRTFSRRNVTFIITSGKACTHNQLQDASVRLGCLPAEEARQLLLSRIHSPETRNKLCKAEKLVELLGFHPLALCIAGSLLSDGYNEDEYIQTLEKEPSDALQVDRRSTDQTSVEKSVKSFFKFLDELEQKALSLLCVFPGSFNSAAAMSLIADSKSISILRELKNRSLVEQPSSGRYQVHQLIQTFVPKLASDRYPALLNQGKKLSCAHFMSRLADNANLYWGKDTCKQSLVSFNEDRHNFQHFLQVYVEGMEKKDPDALELTKVTIAANLLQNCMYLEKCVLPKFYTRVLKGILSSTDSSNQPVHTVELLCLLGHEHRKISGDKNEYERCMKSAEEIYSNNRREFEKNPISEVYYLNSNARFLSEKGMGKQLQQQVEQAMKICSDSDRLKDHPEMAATHFYAGRFAQRHRKYKEARNKFEEALDLSYKCLGKHLMTAECIKNIADIYLYLGQRPEMCIDETEEKLGEAELNKSHEYYEKALLMMKELGVDNHKEMVLTLINFASCQRSKGNLKEATDLLQKAECVAESELEENYMWNVKLKIQWAFLYEEKHKEKEEKSKEKALASMKQGLEMAIKLGKPISELNNKFEILAFINRYPDEFPEDKFPRKSTHSVEAEDNANSLTTTTSSGWDVSHRVLRIQHDGNGQSSESRVLTSRLPRLPQHNIGIGMY